jgi:hypothetical protein
MARAWVERWFWLGGPWTESAFENYSDARTLPCRRRAPAEEWQYSHRLNLPTFMEVDCVLVQTQWFGQE